MEQNKIIFQRNDILIYDRIIISASHSLKLLVHLEIQHFSIIQRYSAPLIFLLKERTVRYVSFTFLIILCSRA